jgi:inosine-uridine nucleoside N-ribohydrolase
MEPLNIKPDLKEFNISLDRLAAAIAATRNLDFVVNSPWTVSEEEVSNVIRAVI